MILVLLLSTTTLTVGFHDIIVLLVVGVMVVAFSSSSLTSLTSILVSISPRVRGVRVAQAGFTLVPLSGLMLASVSGVLDRVHGVVEDLGLNPLLVNPRVYPHPIATFLSYFLLACSTILAVSGVVGPSRVLASASRVVLTSAPVFGGLWSYETLGWGG